MAKCVSCNKNVVSGLVICGDCAQALRNKQKTLYLVYQSGEITGYAGADTQPLFVVSYEELAREIFRRRENEEFNEVNVVTATELDTLRAIMAAPAASDTSGDSQRDAESEWGLTDFDSCQYVKREGDGLYTLIEMGLKNPDTGTYQVYTDTVDVNEFAENEPEDLMQILKSFDYDGISDVSAKYGEDGFGEVTKRIIAECIFEHYNVYHAKILTEGSEQECEAFIKSYVGANEPAKLDASSLVLVPDGYDAKKFAHMKSVLLGDTLYDAGDSFGDFLIGMLRFRLDPDPDDGFYTVRLSVYALDETPQVGTTKGGIPFTWYDGEMSISMRVDDDFDSFTNRLTDYIRKEISESAVLTEKASKPLGKWN